MYASDLRRAVQAVAAPLGVHGQPVRALREIHIGAWEGLTFEEIRARDAAFAAWPVQAAPQGKSLGAVARRVRAVFDAVAPDDRGHVVLVTHGGAITALLCDLLGWDVQAAWAARRGLHGNTALTTLERQADGAWAGAVLACAAHLEEPAVA